MIGSIDGNLEKVKDTIEKGADIDFIGDDLTTALQYAAKSGYIDIVKYLVESGANLEISHQYRLYMTALLYATENNQLEVVKYMVGKKADIDCKRIDGLTALHLSLWRALFDIALYLIENGANVEARDDTGKTPLHWVAYANFDGKI